MELSHWDMVDQFTLSEAAHLGAGIDPNLTVVTPELSAKVTLIRREMYAAFERAQSSALFELAGTIDPNLTIDLVFDAPFGGSEGWSLPSKKLLSAARMAIRLGKPYVYDDAEECPYFTREILDLWFKSKGVQSVYQWIRNSEVDAAIVQSDVEGKPILARERNNLLTIIAALCDYSAIKHQERGAAKQIENMTAEIGALVTEATVLKALNQIPNALERKMK